MGTALFLLPLLFLKEQGAQKGTGVPGDRLTEAEEAEEGGKELRNGLATVGPSNTS